MPLFSCVLSCEFFCVKSAEDFEMAYLGWTMPRAYHDPHFARYILESGGLVHTELRRAAVFSVVARSNGFHQRRIADAGAALPYSCRSATIGSTRIARRAGTYPAKAATAARPKATTPSVA